MMKENRSLAVWSDNCSPDTKITPPAEALMRYDPMDNTINKKLYWQRMSTPIIAAQGLLLATIAAGALYATSAGLSAQPFPRILSSEDLTEYNAWKKKGESVRPVEIYYGSAAGAAIGIPATMLVLLAADSVVKKKLKEEK